MGKRAARIESFLGLNEFRDAVRRQIQDRQRTVRVFDVGGTGVKTALFAATSLNGFLTFEYELANMCDEDQPTELSWIESPVQLGVAPGEDGFCSWLAREVPRLQREVDDPNVVFGVSCAGDVEHTTALLHDWWSGGGHPRQWQHEGRPSPLVADLMGLPPKRTFVIHDGSAHLLGCSRCVVPPPGLACFALGTGVGFGISDSQGAAVDSSTQQGLRSHLINGAPVSGASYAGLWKAWLQHPNGSKERVEEVMSKEFAGTFKPWRTPWTSLVLGRRGMELSEAAHGCPQPDVTPTLGDTSETCIEADVEELEIEGRTEDRVREPAVRAYGEQWLHFLHTLFVPQFTSGTRKHRVERIGFTGGIAEINGAMLRDVLADADFLRTLPESASVVVANERSKRAGKVLSRKRSTVDDTEPRLHVLPLAPRSAGLIGAGIYALAGIGGAHLGIWSV